MGFTNLLKNLLLFLGLLYCLVPFETANQSLSLYIRLFVAILIMLYALYSSDFKIKRHRLGEVTLIFLIALSIFYSLANPSLRTYIFLGVIIFASFTANVIQNNTKFNKKFVTALKWLLIVSISMLVLQSAVYTLTGKVLLLHELVYPLSHARVNTLENFGGLGRLGGMYIEPGTYSNFMYLFLIIYSITTKSITSPLIFIGAITIIFTYSLWGMMFGSYLLIVLTIANIKSLTWKKAYFVIPLLIIGIIIINNKLPDSQGLEFAIVKIEGDSGSVSSKASAYDEFINNIENYILIGDGFDTKFCEDCLSIQDSGVIMILSVIFGMFFVFIILMIYALSWLKQGEWVGLIASLPIFISKVFYWDFSLWLLIFLVIYGHSAKLQQKLHIK